MKVAIYARVSTNDQNVKQQVKHLTQWCKNNNHQVIKTVADTESGRKHLHKRKRFKKLLSNVTENKAKYEAIVIYKLDRLTRNWYDEPMIEKHFTKNWKKCKLISVGDPVDLSCAVGRFNFRVLTALNCYMAEEMKERQRIGIERAKKQGKYKGRKKGSKNKI